MPGDSKIAAPTRLPDGRWLHIVRQSTLTTFTQMCAERVRLQMIGAAPSRTTSSALIGTAVHAGIEHCVNEILQGGEPCDAGEQLAAAMQAWESEECVMHHTEDKARAYIVEASLRWRDQIMPTLRPIAAERHFEGLVLYEDDERVIHAHGTIDLIDDSGVVDWKTSSGPWLPKARQKLALTDGSTRWVGGGAGKRHEVEKWDIQSVLYPWAAEQMGFPCGGNFTWVVMVHDQELVETISVKRDPEHINWVRHLALRYAREAERGLDHPWHLNDAGWWCSAKWAPCWEVCKGKHLAAA